MLKIDLEGDCNLKEIFRKNYRKRTINAIDRFYRKIKKGTRNHKWNNRKFSFEYSNEISFCIHEAMFVELPLMTVHDFD